MFKALKDARRRSVETLHGLIGSSERTSDPEFEAHSERFAKMLDDMCDSGKALSDVLDRQKELTAESLELADVLTKIYSINAENPWPKEGVNEMTQVEAAAAYKEAWDDIHTQLRSSIQVVQSDYGLEPVRTCVQQLRPEYDSAAKTRAQTVVDYDSYRRRLKNLQDKQQINKQQGKDVGNAAAEMKSEIERYEAKKTAAESSYNDQNTKLKAKINQAKSMHDALMDDFLITSIVTQAELFARAAQKLQQVVSLLPQDKVIKTKAQIETMLDPNQPRRKPSVVPVPAAAGSGATAFLFGNGSAAAAAQPKESAQQSVPFARSGASPSTPVSSSSAAATASSSSSSSAASLAPPAVPSSPAPSAGNPFGEEKTAAASGSSSPRSSAPKAKYVVALYDHVADADDELDFSVGEKFEVIEQGDGGWWTGRCHGKVGLFPVNYVDASGLA